MAATLKEYFEMGIANLKRTDIPQIAHPLGEAQLRQAYSMLLHKDVSEDEFIDDIQARHPDCVFEVKM